MIAFFEGADYMAGFNNLGIWWTRSLAEAYKVADFIEAAYVVEALNSSFGTDVLFGEIEDRLDPLEQVEDTQ